MGVPELSALHGGGFHGRYPEANFADADQAKDGPIVLLIGPPACYAEA